MLVIAWNEIPIFRKHLPIHFSMLYGVFQETHPRKSQLLAPDKVWSTEKISLVFWGQPFLTDSLSTHSLYKQNTATEIKFNEYYTFKVSVQNQIGTIKNWVAHLRLIWRTGAEWQSRLFSCPLTSQNLFQDQLQMMDTHGYQYEQRRDWQAKISFSKRQD